MDSNKLFNLTWEKYLALLFLLLGAGFFSSGIVSWVAANWDYFSKFQKLYVAQFSLGASLLIAVIFYRRESRFDKTGVKTVSSIFFFITAIFVGTLFALIGQIYQTGANAWELFALWSILQIPLLLLLPNIGNALLLMVTLNITLGLYADTFNLYKITLYLFAGLNLFIVILAEVFYKKLYDEHWRIVPKIANIALAVSLFFIVIDSFDYWKFLSLLVPIGFIIFYRKRLEFFSLIVHFTALIINFDTFLIIESFNTNTVVIAILFTLCAFLFGLFQLKKLFFIRYPNLEMSSVVQVMFIILSVCMTALILSLIHLLRIDDSIILVISAVLFIVALIFHYNKSQKYLVDLLMAIGGMLTFIYFMYNQKSIISEGEDYQFGYSVLTMMLYLGLIYYFKSTFWLRSLAVSLLVILFLEHFKIYSFEFYDDKKIKNDLLQQFFGWGATYWLMFGTIILFYLKGKFSVNSHGKAISKAAVNITPVAWAFIILAYGSYFSSPFFRWRILGEAPELPVIDSFFELFNVLTGHIFLNLEAQWWLYHLLYFSVCFLPLFMFFLISRNFSLRSSDKWGMAVVLGLFSISFIAANIVLFCFALLLVAYINSSRVLFAIAILFLIKSLSFYYYLLAIPLLYKSFLLLVFGLIFFLFSALLYKSFSINDRTNETTQSAVGNLPILKPIFSLITLVLILSIANYSIIKYEDVLNNGKPIIVKLAPVDPRSLMQGDYMALNYEIVTEFRQQFYNEDSEGARMHLSEDKQNIYKAYMLVKTGEKNAVQLCRVELSPPTDFTGCQEGVYLPVNTSNPWNPTLPSHSYFFAEGKGAYYAKAEYGEYRFKDGKALLARLLDKDLTAL